MWLGVGMPGHKVLLLICLSPCGISCISKVPVPMNRPFPNRGGTNLSAHKKFPQQRVRKSLKTNHITFLFQLPCYVPCNTTTIIPHNTTYWNTTLPLMAFQHRPLCWPSIWTFNTDFYAGRASGLSTQTFMLAEHLDFKHRLLCWLSIWTFNTDLYSG